MNTLETLGAREREILRFYALGLSGKQIADRLEISPRTVEEYRRRFCLKLGLKLYAACAQAGKAGWV